MSAKPNSPSDGPGARSAGRVAFAALRHADYRRYFSVLMLAQMGDNIESSIRRCSPALPSLVIGRRFYFSRSILALWQIAMIAAG